PMMPMRGLRRILTATVEGSFFFKVKAASSPADPAPKTTMVEMGFCMAGYGRCVARTAACGGVMGFMGLSKRIRQSRAKAAKYFEMTDLIVKAPELSNPLP
ncbi:MAG TPA: hypothetical protein VGE67_09230, partial [Haloferula sp.]